MRLSNNNLVQENTMSFLKAFLKDESGATMIEYGLVAALVSVAAIIALQILGAQLQIIFNTVSSYLSSASGT
jgi:pilus assembly protein Flp/PilA